MKIILTPEQSSWIARNFYKISDVQKDSDKKRKIKRIADKCIKNGKAVDLNKIEARAVIQAVEVGVKALTLALEKYEKDEKKYAEYIEAATDKKAALEALLDKIKRKLK